ncbi:MAG: response regulator [Acidobacteria bacterium]|uniref:histidine kinase n=1 Tax=Candidatus Polarisedimenticola svalbardensis TaxID=2886004 RepID=A0A8J6Y0N6_9BACT|nr:response regulator [Candidatus Polarisedimenticola svalbardensis]
MIRELYRRSTLERSFIFSIGLIMSVMLVVIVLLVQQMVAATLRQGLEERGKSVARSIGAVATPSLLAYNHVALQMAAENAAEGLDLAYVAIHTKEGDLAGFAGLDSEGTVRADLQSGGIAGTVASRDLEIRAHDGSFVPVMEVAVPVWVDGVTESWGMVRVGMSRKPVARHLWRLTAGLVLSGLLFSVLAIFFGRWVARAITAPLRRLVEGTEALAEGKYDYRVPVSGSNELAQMAAAFNSMMDRTQSKAEESREFQEALESLNATLEDQVRERTRALEESEEQYKTLVDSSPDSILIIQGGKVRFVNQAFIGAFGVSARRALQPDFKLESLFEPESARVASERLRAWEEGHSTGPCELVGRNSNGAVLHLELRGSRIEYLGAPAAECVVIDNTVAKSLREQLVDTERLRALGELSGGVAHDFNNLLGAILGRAQLLRRENLDESVDLSLSVIEKAAVDGRETVRRIQEFSRTRQERNFNRLELPEIIRDAVEITRTRWKTESERRNINVRLDLSLPGTAAILGKDSELREVFTNLILNALDAMPDGGVLRIRCVQDDGLVIAEVTDSGVGMAEETRRHLFDPFFTTKGQGGTGLGLSMVYGIVTRHGGRIDVTSDIGKGTTFFIEFPVAAMLADLPAESVQSDDGEVPPSRILVIDDEQDIAEILRDVLTAEGHSVEMAGGGQEGLEKVAGTPFDLVFTDLGMPDVSGWEVASTIRENHPDLPVVLVTGWGATLTEEEIAENCIAAVVNKPFDIDSLVNVTTSILGRASSDDPL